MMRQLVPMVVVCLLVGRAAASEPTQGTLRARDGDRVIDVPLEHTDVRIRVSGHLVDAEVRQVFKNPFDRKIEAVYLFPLPGDAAVNALDLETSGRVIHGEIRRRADARRVYERARAEGRVAVLLEQERPNLFSQRVANLEPGARVTVRLRYVQALAPVDGAYELVFPMVAPPRFVPKGSATEAEAARVQPQVLPPGTRSSHEVSLSVELETGGLRARGLTSPSHRIVDDGGRLSLAPGDTIPNKDFVLRWSLAGDAPAFALLAHRAAGAPGSFYLLAEPPHDAAPSQVAPRELVFVVDTSSSMRGAPLRKARELLGALLGGLRPDDTFQIVRFADRAATLGAAPIAARAANVERALAWLDALPARGGTIVTSGIETALAVPHDPGRLRLVVFVTDGFVGNEDEILALVQAKMGAARLFAFGIGSAVNRWLLEEMAAAGRGAAAFVRADEDGRAAIERFHRRIDRAVLTDLTIDWGGLAVSDLTPAAPPDLFLGQPLVLAGRYRAAGSGVVTIRGRQGGREVAFRVTVTLPEALDRPAVATVWARARIGDLMRRLVRRDDPALVAEITELALASHLVSRFTSFVAVDAASATGGGPARSVTVPVEVPEGVSAGASGGGFGFGMAGFGAGGGGGSYGIGYGGGAAGYGISTVGHAVTVPQVRIAAVTVMGSLDKSLIRRHVRAELPKIRHCYEVELKAAPDLRATAVAKFTIGGDGAVVAASVDGTGHEAMENCISGVIHGLRFPTVEGGGLVHVTYPFELKPEE